MPYALLLLAGGGLGLGVGWLMAWLVMPAGVRPRISANWSARTHRG